MSRGVCLHALASRMRFLRVVARGWLHGGLCRRWGILAECTGLTLGVALSETEPRLIVGTAPPVVFPALNTVGLAFPYTGDDDADGSMAVEYRRSGQEWRPGHPGLRVEAFYEGGTVARRELATRIFNLAPGTTYEVRATFSDPDGVIGPQPMVLKVSTRPEPVISNVNGRVWHVAPNVATGVTTDEKGPLVTLDEAIANACAGETILLDDGVYELTNRYGLVLKSSGTAEAPIVIRAAPGAKPVLRGPKSGLESPGAGAWRKEEPTWPGVYSAALAEKPAQVYWKTHYLGWCDSLEHLVAGQCTVQGKARSLGLCGGWYWSEGRLYVKIPSRWNDWAGPCENPSVGVVQTVRSNFWGLMPKGRYLVLDGLTFEYLARAIYLQVVKEGEADGLVVRNCHFRYFNDGIHAYQTSSSTSTGAFRNVLVERCTFFGSPSYSLREWTLGHDLYGTQGIVVSGIRGATAGVVRRCEFRDCENGIFIGCFNPEVGQCDLNPGWVIEGCRFERIGDDSIELEGPSCNTVVSGNSIAQGHVAFSLAPAGCGPVWVIRNTVYFSDWTWPDGSVRTGEAIASPYGIFKFNSGYNFPGRYILCVAYHNSVVIDTTHSPITAVTSKWNTREGLWWISRNNSFVLRKGPDRVLRIYRPTEPDSIHVLDMDYDNLWIASTNGFASVWEAALQKVVVYATPEEFRRAGYNLHGCSLLPKHADPEKGDFAVPADDPLVDAGVRIPGVNDDFRGAGPDIGATER